VLLEAMSHPARVCSMPPALPCVGSAEIAALAALLTLADTDTPVCLIAAPDALRDYLRFHCGCPITSHPKDAAFGLIGDERLAMRAFEFPVGSDEYPDRSATVIIQVRSLVDGTKQTLTGPGIESTAELAPTLPADFWAAWRANTALYPRGIDVIFACGERIMALPRSSQLEA
jgi:alpha-D-ribose 1-methylphosphonate 5-triphosphate synthase subunit PhnH